MDLSKCDIFLQKYNTCCDAAKAAEAAALKPAGASLEAVPPA
jgi:hypothetical protein